MTVPADRGSGVRRVGSRVVLAHDAAARTCDKLLEALPRVVRLFELEQVGSLAAGEAALATPAPRGAWTLVIACLDLPPAPRAGAQLAASAAARGLPVVLVTRSLRWLPEGAEALARLPWVSPSATADELARAVAEAQALRLVRPAPRQGLAWPNRAE